MKTRSLALLLLVGGAAPAYADNNPPLDRTRPPAATSESPWQPEAPVRFRLENGLEVLLIERHQVPLVDVMVQVRSGALEDPLDLPGLAVWTSGMLTEGAGRYDALALADAVDYLGASLDADASWEGSRVMLHVPAARLDQGMALLADVTLRPNFPAAEWERYRSERQTEFLQWRDSPYALSQLAQSQSLFGGHRYGEPRGGTPTSLARTTVADLREFHRTRFTVDNAFVVVVGDTNRAEVEVLLDKHLGKFSQRPVGFRPPVWRAPTPRAATPEIVLVDRPGAPQSVVAAVVPAPLGLAPLDGPTEAMNTLLGGSFMSRLNQNLREDKQYAYGARSSFDLRPGANVFVASTSVATPVTAPGVVEVRRELERIRTYIEDSESQRASGYRALTFPGAFETGGAVASLWAWAHLRGVSADDVITFPERVLSTTPRAMLDAARKNLALQGLRFVVVGDRAAIGEELRKLQLGKVREVRPEELLPPAPPTSATRRP